MNLLVPDQDRITSSDLYEIPIDLIKKERTWRKICGAVSGVYFYSVDEPVHYPFGASRTVYIGKGKNLAHRIAWHFRRDTVKRLLPDRDTSAWFCQNYYLKHIPFEIRWVLCRNTVDQDLKDIERLFIGLFATNFGSAPPCNGSVQRRKLLDTYQKYQEDYSDLVSHIERLVLTH